MSVLIASAGKYLLRPIVTHEMSTLPIRGSTSSWSGVPRLSETSCGSGIRWVGLVQGPLW